jgi:two-component system response regulator RegA
MILAVLTVEDDPSSWSVRNRMRNTNELIKFRLLIVEDDGSIRRVWHEIFNRRGWDVAAADTVAEGLALLEPAPDFLILDLSLPDGCGEVILRKVREDNLRTRVTVMTGVDDVARLRRVRQLRPEALLRKPIDVADVFREGQLASSG